MFLGSDLLLSGYVTRALGDFVSSFTAVSLLSTNLWIRAGNGSETTQDMMGIFTLFVSS